MNLRIEKTTMKDLPATIELMREFAAYEGLLDHFDVTTESLADAMFGKSAFVKGLLALDGDNPIGYAIFFPYFASFRGQRGFYLEDIFVTENFRKFGVGQKLLRAVARIAKEQGAVRLDFQVLKWNAPAVNFYKKHGAVVDKDELHFKFTNEAFERLA